MAEAAAARWSLPRDVASPPCRGGGAADPRLAPPAAAVPGKGDRCPASPRLPTWHSCR